PTIRVSDSTPITRMSKHITATVYGRRRARRTIHIGADYRGPKSSRRPSQVNRDREGGGLGAHRRGKGAAGTSDKKSARNARTPGSELSISWPWRPWRPGAFLV